MNTPPIPSHPICVLVPSCRLERIVLLCPLGRRIGPTFRLTGIVGLSPKNGPRFYKKHPSPQHTHTQCRDPGRLRNGFTWWGLTQCELRFGYRVPGSSVYCSKFLLMFSGVV